MTEFHYWVIDSCKGKGLKDNSKSVPSLKLSMELGNIGIKPVLVVILAITLFVLK